MRSKRAIVVAFLAAFLVARAANGDIVKLLSGGRVTGQIVGESDHEVRVKTATGIVAVPRDEIESIERGGTPAEIFKERLQSLKKDDADAHFALGEWAKEQGLAEQAKQAFERAIAISPDHEKARAALGYKREKGEWLTPEQYAKLKGLVLHEGRYVTPEERERLEQAKRQAFGVPRAERASAPGADRPETARPEPSKGAKPEAARAPAPKPVELPEDVKALVALCRSKDPSKRHAAIEAVLDRGGDEGRALVKDALQKEREKRGKEVVDYFRDNKNELRTKLAEVLKARRKVAHDFIMDPSKYPDANHGAAAQPEVDRLVGEVERIYKTPYFEVKVGREPVQKLWEAVQEIVADQEKYLKEPQGEVEAAVAEECAKVLQMSVVPVDAQDAKTIAFNADVDRYNKAVRCSLTTEERACVEATNDYRAMFGLQKLYVFEPLVQAGRKHSDEMKRLQYFDHNSPNPENRTPDVRCAREGARYSGENIAMGMATGVAAFRAWYTSSGHHRNILTRDHRTLGIGQAGSYWTQDFGVDSIK